MHDTERKELVRKRIIAILLMLVGTAAMVAIGIVVGKPFLEMLDDPAAFRAWVDARGFLGKLAFVGVMMLQVIIVWLPGEPLELGAGYAFGFWEGSLLCMVGIVLGSVLIFWLVRRYGRRVVTLFFSMDKIDNLSFLKDAKRLTLLSFIIFMIPGTPKDLLTYAVGLTSMKLSSWLLIAGVARIPPVITSTISGSALGQQQYGLAIAGFAITIAISLIGVVVYRKISLKPKGETA